MNYSTPLLSLCIATLLAIFSVQPREGPTHGIRLHESNPTDKYTISLDFSWSAESQQDTLEITESGWVTCYLRCHFSDTTTRQIVCTEGWFMHSESFQITTIRRVIAGEEQEIELDSESVWQWISMVYSDCPSCSGTTLLAEFDVFINVTAMDETIGSDGVGFFTDGSTSPLVAISIVPDCSLAASYPVTSNTIIAVNPLVSNTSLPFGSVKALYRIPRQRR